MSIIFLKNHAENEARRLSRPLFFKKALCKVKAVEDSTLVAICFARPWFGHNDKLYKNPDCWFRDMSNLIF